MIKKTITYTDYNGNERTEDFYFNLSEAELTEMEMSVSGGFTTMVKSIIDAQDAPALIKIFKELVKKSYGVKSADGKFFRKSEEATADFLSTEAYSIIFMELASNDEKASEFINGVVPAKLAERAAKEQAKLKD